jgi:hypothetical protein
MALPSVAIPKEWQDWANLLVGIWLCASPFVLQIEDAPAIRVLLAVGFLVIAAEVLTLSPLRVWEEWINVVLGLWLVVSPWFAGMASSTAAANCIVAGVLLIALAVYEIWDNRREPERPT